MVLACASTCKKVVIYYGKVTGDAGASQFVFRVNLLVERNHRSIVYICRQYNATSILSCVRFYHVMLEASDSSGFCW